MSCLNYVKTFKIVFFSKPKIKFLLWWTWHYWKFSCYLHFSWHLVTISWQRQKFNLLYNILKPSLESKMINVFLHHYKTCCQIQIGHGFNTIYPGLKSHTVKIVQLTIYHGEKSFTFWLFCLQQTIIIFPFDCSIKTF